MGNKSNVPPLSHHYTTQRPSVLLATSEALLIMTTSQHRVRLLIDPGSELSFISDKLVKQLRLQRLRSSTPIVGIGGQLSTKTVGTTAVTLRSAHSTQEVSVTAHILSQLTTTLPTFFHDHLHDSAQWPHLRNLQLADSHFLTPGVIDMIIGADSYGLIVKTGIKKGLPDEPIAQNTIFGWAVLGPVEDCTFNPCSAHQASLEPDNDRINELLTKFWTQEEIISSPEMTHTAEEEECEDHFKKTHTRDEHGRYIVRVPLAQSTQELGDSYNTAYRCLLRLLKKLSIDEKYKSMYTAFLSEYEELGHMRRAPTHTPLNSTMYYLPHHGVLREDRVTTKLRVVFNGSSLTSSGRSLNDIQHTGAKLQVDIFDVLLWFRRFQYVFATDITKMFRQIDVHPDDWDLQRILWVDEQLNIVPYQLTTVTYGTKSAPFLSVRTLLQLVEDEGHRFPLAVTPLIKGRYVDDIYGGADTLSELEVIAQQLTQLCSSGGFPLDKWQSNNQLILNSVSGGTVLHDSSHHFEENSTKVLGLTWLPQSDCFKFKRKPDSSSAQLTKRIMLSEMAQIFDPLGFLAPFVIKAKMLLQELWLEKLSWDDPLSAQINSKWSDFRGELTSIEDIKCPRWIQLSNSSKIELHGFSDASQLAMSAVVYLVSRSSGTGPVSTMVCAKTKVAPLKRLTIPRLELTAALLLSKLVSSVFRTLELDQIPVNLWTDSSVTLTWITAHPSRWKDFVRNRVSSIQELTQNHDWRFVPGKENPADCASRGISTAQLKKHHLWWTGPSWLLKTPDCWPATPTRSDSTAQLEERPGLSFVVTTTPQEKQWELISTYSSLYKLLRVTALCQRAVAVFKGDRSSSTSTPLNSKDIDKARRFWVKSTQAICFEHETKMLRSSTQLPRTHPFTSLTVFIDSEGILRVGGRLHNSPLNYDTRHPIVLPRDSPLTRLLIKEYHLLTLHSGTQLTLSQLRTKYWIIGGRNPVKSFILRCVTCARYRGTRAQQLMGQLPISRVTPSRPFQVTGVDYAGPLTLRKWKGSRGAPLKGWLCIFVCFSTSAVHLEPVSDYSAETFVAAYRRFISRRGICSTLISDCGTTFQGADTILQQLFTQGTAQFDSLTRIFANDGTLWKFNPPAAPHMGGKWEAAVKSVKYHLKRVTGEVTLTFEELTTLLTQIEAILNSRPLCPISDDPEDINALTPAHFLIGDLLTVLPSPSIEDLARPELKRWQMVQQRMQYFWNRWSREYLQKLLATTKWHHASHDINVGSLVLITDERFPPAKWPLARVISTHPGDDGLTRVVTLKTASTTLVRPIAKLAVLPVTSPEHNSTPDQLNHQFHR